MNFLYRWHIAGHISIPGYNEGRKTSITGSVIAPNIKVAIECAEENGWSDITDCSIKTGNVNSDARIGFE